jgi:hypothetical protein
VGTQGWVNQQDVFFGNQHDVFACHPLMYFWKDDKRGAVNHQKNSFNQECMCDTHVFEKNTQHVFILVEHISWT